MRMGRSGVKAPPLTSLCACIIAACGAQFNDAGEPMEPFNLKNERTEGYFDETGNFVWKKEMGQLDPWLASLDNEQDLEAKIGEAASAKRKW